MACKAFFAFLVLFSFAFCEAKAENCSEVQCKIFPVEEDLASEFRHKASEKGVRLVYINLIIGNATYDPLDLPDEFLPHRWVWANTVKESMLTLPDDYDILYFGLLNNQFRSMDMKMEDQPSGCLVNLNSTCQNMAVGRMLLEIVTIKSTGEKVQKKPVVCVEVIKDIKIDDIKNRNIYYHCCGMHQGQTGSASIRCDQTVDIGNWMRALNTFFVIFSGILSFFLPALPLALPDCVFSLQAECEKEKRLEEQNNNTETPGDHQNMNGATDEPSNPSTDEQLSINRHSSYQGTSDSEHDTSNPRENTSEQIKEESETIPVDDSSPMNLLEFLIACIQRLPDFEKSFNVKLAIMLLGICPSVLYVQIGLYGTVKKMHVNESIKKHVKNLYGLSLVPLQIVGLDLNDTTVIIHFVVLLSMIIPLLSLRPGAFILEKGIICRLCKKFNSEVDVPYAEKRSVADEMRHHLAILNHYMWKFIGYFGDYVRVACDICICSNSCTEMRRKPHFPHIICVFFNLISFPFALILTVVWWAISFFVLLIASLFAMMILSPYSSLFNSLQLKVLAKLVDYGKFCFVFVLVFYYFVILSLVSSIITSSCLFITSAIGYTIMGLTLNVGIVAPYVAFLVVLTTNVYLCYSNMQSKYKEVKKMILKRKEELQLNSSDPKDTIRAELYWQVCDKVLPIKTEMCVMFRNMGLVLLFLFLVVYSIVFFGTEEYDVSFVTSTMYVFFSGAIPPLVLRRLTNSDKIIGRARIKMEREIGKVVEEYRDSGDAGAVTQSPV